MMNAWRFVALYLLVLSLTMVGVPHFIALACSAACLLAGLIPDRSREHEPSE